MYCLACNVPCIVCVYMCTEQLPPGGYPIAVKYIISYHQELSNCSSSLWFYLRIVVIVVLCSWSARPQTQHDYYHDTKVKPEAATAVIKLLMMSGKTPETCWAVNKRQDNKLENFCIWLVIYLNCYDSFVKKVFSLTSSTLSTVVLPHFERLINQNAVTEFNKSAHIFLLD